MLLKALLPAQPDQFENVRVYVNGVLLDSFDPSTGAGYVTKSIDSNLTLNAGDNEIKVVAKAKTTATNNAAFKALLVTGGTTSDIFYGKNAQYVASGNAVSGSIGGTATGAVFTVGGAVLTTVRSDGYANGKTIVKGSTDVSLGKFTLKATNDAITVNSISLGANASTTSTSDTSIYDMKVFVDGVQVGNTVDFTSTGANFSSLNFTVAKDATKAVEIKGSFDSSATGGFLTTMTVNAQDSRGKEIVDGNTAPTSIFALADQGSLNVEVGGNTPAAAILAAKSTEQEVAQFKFTAVNDSASLTEINVVNWDGTQATSTADSRIAAVKLYDGSTLLDSFVPVNGAGKFTINNDAALVASNVSKTLSIKVVLNNIDNDATATNKDIRMQVTTVKFKSSAGTVTTKTANIAANNFRVRKTVPTVALVALPTTTLTSGDQVISKFTVSADANGDVAVNTIVLNTTNTSNATITALSVGSVLKVNGSYKTVASVATTTTTMTIVMNGDEVVSAGSSKTFEILATLAVSGQGSESVTTKISEDTTYGTTGNFVWSDGASVSAPTYSNAYRVPGLTTTTQTLSK